MTLDLNQQNSYVVTREDVEQTFQIICKYSIHSFMDDIKRIHNFERRS